MDLSLKIDVIDFLGKKDFNDKYFFPQKPVVIKGLTEYEIAGKKWSLKYFKDTMGDVEVGVFDNKNKKSAGSALTSPDLKMKLSDFISTLESNPKTDLRIFLFDFYKHNPLLRREFPCPKIFSGVMDKMGYLFFGGKDTTVRIHYDIDMSNVLLTHFGGRKKVVLVGPEYSDLLYCLPLNTYSLINLGNIDYQKYPALAHVKGYECVLEHGDSIFMPSGYWHYITYLDNSFSVSYRKIAPDFSKKVKGLVNVSIKMPLDKLIGKTFGKSWLIRKEQIANQRAEKAVLRMQKA
ncbi:MAG: cupin-like domain-containing protein [Cytophagaceae bacterium]|nr:cupin-like domain-containing protein [Cytophagaceae bacterium]MBL0300968.1 cupin-like domain-containing protein [Cytophagaceae bacterium]MBL0323778.1 cupin-like domain-containing protein [Cytophagaceae bacterium]